MKFINPSLIFVWTDGQTSPKQYAPSRFSKVEALKEGKILLIMEKLFHWRLIRPTSRKVNF